MSPDGDHSAVVLPLEFDYIDTSRARNVLLQKCEAHNVLDPRFKLLAVGQSIFYKNFDEKFIIGKIIGCNAIICPLLPNGSINTNAGKFVHLCDCRDYNTSLVN